MNDRTRELETQLRDAQSKISASETTLADAKRQRIQLSVWSAVGGFMLFAVGGHWFPGYQLDSTARESSKENAANAVSDVMAELCADRFMRTAGLETRLASLKGETGDWSKANYIREGAWAETPDGEKSDHATAVKCVARIADRMTPESGKTS